MSDKIQIQNSTADFLISARQSSDNRIEVRVQDENVWLTVEGVVMFFEKERTIILEHLQKIYNDGERKRQHKS